MPITIGSPAGHHFHGQADLELVNHVTRTLPDGKQERGYLHRRKRLRDRQAFEYDPRLGWECDVWFEWDDNT